MANKQWRSPVASTSSLFHFRQTIDTENGRDKPHEGLQNPVSGRPWLPFN